MITETQTANNLLLLLSSLATASAAKMLEIEGIGSEVVLATVLLGAIVTFALVAWKSACRSPLDYDIYMVETTSEDPPPAAVHGEEQHRRRAIHVMHLGYEERRIAGTDLVQRMAEGRVLPRVDDLSVVIQSPSTIVESELLRMRMPDDELSSVRAWLMEVGGDYDPSWVNSGLAAALAIAISNGRDQITLENGQTINLTEYRERDRDAEIANRPGTPHHELSPATSSDDDVDNDDSDEDEDGGEGDNGPPLQAHSASASDSSRTSLTSTPDREVREILQAMEAALDAGLPAPPLPSGKQIRIRLKFLDDTQMDVVADDRITIAEFKDQHLTEILTRHSVRLIFRGALLRNDDRTLEESGWHDECVVHVLLGDRAPSPVRNPAPEVSTPPARGILRRRENALAMRLSSSNQEGFNGYTIREDPLDTQVQESVGVIREIMVRAFVVTMSLVEHLAGTWLGVARFMREALVRRMDDQRERGEPAGFIDRVMFRMAEHIGVLPTADAPLQRTPTLSFLFPLILCTQIVIAWSFVLAFPRFFDYVSIFFLSLITFVFALYALRRNGEQRIDVRQPR